MSSPSEMSFASRVALAFACFFRVLAGGSFALAVQRLGDGSLAPTAGTSAPGNALPAAPGLPAVAPAPTTDSALELLALLQREGRLLDFLEEDIATFADADVGAAARLVHEGCRRALRDHVPLEPIRSEEEGARVAVEAGFDAQRVKLLGDVSGSFPVRGTLRHRGWRATSVTLPVAVGDRDVRVLAPAEVEVGA